MPNIWVIACGRAANNQWVEMWPIWRKNQIITIGSYCHFPLAGNNLDQIGGLIRQRFPELNEGEVNAQANLANNFSNILNEGDIIICRVGFHSVLGVGRLVNNDIGYVENPYPPGTHYNFRHVNWLQTFENPQGIQNAFYIRSVIGNLQATCDDNYESIAVNHNNLNTQEKGIRLINEVFFMAGLIEHYDNINNDIYMNNAINSILYGPPGTGKTYITAEKAVQICSNDFEIDDAESAEDERKQIMDEYKKLVESKRISFVTFHQSYGYEEFVEGLKPILDISNDEANSNSGDSGQVKYHISDGAFKEICEKARKDENNKYVIIIDEINRGNISKIFGELITLIEEDKREGELNQISVVLPYSKQSFSVPKNIYIIGTMNTADRSLANVDTALRRRFHFEPMMPDLNVLDNLKVGDIDIKKILETINQRIEALYDREHTIGHAYFTKLFIIPENERFNELELIFRNKVIPLLEEYFFDDWQKIRLVLGDNQKSTDYQFIYEKETNYNQLFGNNELTDNYETKSYQINNESFGREQSYIGIYTVQNNEQ